MSTAARTRRRLLLKDDPPAAESENVRSAVAALLVFAVASPVAGCESGTKAPTPEARTPQATTAKARAAKPPPTGSLSAGAAGSVGRSISIGGTPDEVAPPSVAVLHGRLWALGAGALRSIDTRRERAAGVTARVPSNAAVLQSGVGALWSVDLNGGHVLRFDGARVRRSRLAQVPARALATSDSGVWVATPTLTGGGTRISRLDPSTLFRTATVRLRFPVYQLVAAGGRVWMLDQSSGRLVGLGGPAGRAEAVVRFREQPSYMVAAGGWLWVLLPTTQGTARKVVRIDPRSGRRARPALRVRGDVRALTAEGDRIWTVETGWLRTFDIHSGRPLGRSVPIGFRPVDVERLNGRLWVVDEHGLRRVSPSLPARAVR